MFHLLEIALHARESYPRRAHAQDRDKLTTRSRAEDSQCYARYTLQYSSWMGYLT